MKVERNVDRRLAVLGALLASLGLYLPWIRQAHPVTDVGIAINWGWHSFQLVEALALLPAVAILFIAGRDSRSRTRTVLAAASGLLYVCVPLFVLGRWGELLPYGEHTFVPGIGLYVTCLGGFVLLASGVVRFRTEISATSGRTVIER
jgi:hypothetical protein